MFYCSSEAQTYADLLLKSFSFLKTEKLFRIKKEEDVRRRTRVKLEWIKNPRNTDGMLPNGFPRITPQSICIDRPNNKQKNGTQQSGNWNSLTAFRDYSLIAGRAFGDERKREREGEGCASQGCCALKLILSRSVEIQLIRDKKHNFGYRVHSNSLDGSHWTPLRHPTW